MKVHALQIGDPRWSEVADFTDCCSWVAGPRLAQKMRTGDFKPWERVFIAERDRRIVGFCTLTEKDCIPDIHYAPFIGFVFVAESHRGHRISQALIQAAAGLARKLHHQTVYIATREQGLYEKYGFVEFDRKPDHWGDLESILKLSLASSAKNTKPRPTTGSPE